MSFLVGSFQIHSDGGQKQNYENCVAVQRLMETIIFYMTACWQMVMQKWLPSAKIQLKSTIKVFLKY